MGFEVCCRRQDLLLAVLSTAAVAPTHSTKPILSNLQLTVRDNGLEIVATDLQIGLRATVRRLESSSAGGVIVPAQQLASILKESGSAGVRIVEQDETETQQVLIELDDGRYRMPAIIGETFPEVCPYPTDQAQRMQIAAADLETAIRRSAFAMDKERGSAVLSGQLLVAAGDTCTLTATDGKVLSEVTVAGVQVQGAAELRCILPAATVGHLSRLLAGSAQGPVELAVARNLVFARLEQGEDEGPPAVLVELTGRLIEGTYPPYRTALERTSDLTVSFDARALGSAIRRTALMTSTNSRGIVIELQDGSAVFKNLNHHSGSARIELPCGGNARELRLGINATYFLEVLRAFVGDTVVIELNGTNRGMVMRDRGATFLLMPISLSA